MKIVTKTTSNASGRSQVIAKGGGRQKTHNVDLSKSNDWNHGTAAGALLLATDPDDPFLLAWEDWKHETNESGTVHTFTF